MGYYSRAEGELRFTDELSEEELSAFSKDVYDNLCWAGTFSSTGWTATDCDSTKLYYLEDEAQRLVDTLRGFGIRAEGQILVTGEETGDIWRLVFKGGKVEKQTAEIRWPDGTPVQL